MMTKKTILQIPVEEQIREFDAKLLLACIAAKRGYSSVVGNRKELKSRIASFPGSIYISKDLRSGSKRKFEIMRQLGYKIVAWDEEAVVHQPPAIYFSRRLSPLAIKYASHLFAWGEDSAKLWRQYPDLPQDTTIHITGNPRGDLLRPEMRPFFRNEVQKIRDSFGDFILINTNFNHVNAFHPELNLLQPVKSPAEIPKFGRSTIGMSREYVEGWRDHKQAIFEAFKQLIPALDRAFPDKAIIIRPHPMENDKVYRKIAAQCKHVQVTNESNVVPWLLAAKALIHNGCTTAVEAYALQLPAISYRAIVNEDYDDSFYHLPNMLSHQCFDLEGLQAILKKILADQLSAGNDNERQALFAQHLAAQKGSLACERIIDVLDKTADSRSKSPKPSLRKRLEEMLKTTRYNMKKRSSSHLSVPDNRPMIQRFRFPGVSIAEVCERVSRFQQLLGEDIDLKVDQIGENIFHIRT